MMRLVHTHWLTGSLPPPLSKIYALTMQPWLVASHVTRGQYERAMHIHAKPAACLVCRNAVVVPLKEDAGAVNVNDVNMAEDELEVPHTMGSLYALRPRRLARWRGYFPS